MSAIHKLELLRSRLFSARARGDHLEVAATTRRISDLYRLILAS